MLAHSSERANSDSEGEASKVETQKRKHSVRAYLSKNQKRSILRSEKYGDLKTAEHKILNEGRESRNNHQYDGVVPILVTQWNPCQTKTSQETEKNLRKFTEPASIVKNYHGIMEQLHFIDQRQAELQNELYVEQKKRHQPYFCNLD